MKKSFQKTLIAAAVLATAGAASANSLLFPYFTTAAGAQSVLTITGNGTVAGNAGTLSGSERLHYVYNYGAECTHNDKVGNITPNDVLQHSIAGVGYGGFGKVQGTDASNPAYLNLSGTQGFLTVTNVGAAGVTGPVTGAAINGEMAIIDPTTGLMVSYAGISNGAAVPGDYQTITDRNFELSFYPNTLVETSFYAVVVGNMNPAIFSAGVGSGYGTSTNPFGAGGRDWKGGATLTNNGYVWANDEVGSSGTKTTSIVCAGTITPSSLMTSTQVNDIGANAGLIRTTSAQATGTTFDASTGLVVVKMQKILPAAGMASGTKLLHRVLAAN